MDKLRTSLAFENYLILILRNHEKLPPTPTPVSLFLRVNPFDFQEKNHLCHRSMWVHPSTFFSEKREQKMGLLAQLLPEEYLASL